MASGSPYFYNDLGANSTIVDMTVDSGASVYFGATQHLDSLTINSGGFVKMLPTGEVTAADAVDDAFTTGGQLLDTNTLVVNGILDLTDCDMLVNTPASDALDTIQYEVGYGANDDPGTQGTIVSSTATEDGMVLGIAPESDIDLPSLDGETIPSTALVARYTIYGDVFLQGYVDAPSVNTVISNYRSGISSDPPAFWQGDFFYDGYVASYDVNAVISNYHSGVTNTNPFPNASNVGTPISVTLPATEPTLGTIIRNDVNWGDGNFDSYPAGVTTAYHTYTSIGTPEIQMTAVAADGAVYHPPAIPMAVSNTGVTATALSLAASASTDVFAITSNGTNTIITKNGTTIEDEPTENILALSITGGAADLLINFTNGDPLPIGGIFTDAANIELDGPHGTDPLMTNSTAAYIGSDEIRHPSATTLTDHLTSDGGILAIDGTTNLNNPAGDSLTVAPGATVFVNGNQTFSSLTIDAGATVRLGQNGTAVLATDALVISASDGANSGGVLDLADNDLIVHDGDLAAIAAYLKNGYDNKNWDGESTDAPTAACILSSIAAADPSQIEALGFAQIGSSTSTGQLNLSSFDGQTISAGDVVVKLTYYGDANLDGTVNSTDEAMINSSLTGWSNGDFNYDGSVNGSDESLYSNIAAKDLPAGSITLAADADFPVSSLPSETPNGISIADWQANWGNGGSDTFAPTDAVANPYSNTTATYSASLVALDDSGSPIYTYPHMNVSVTYVPPPAAPTDLTAKVVSPNEIDLNWTNKSSTASQNGILISIDGTDFGLFAVVASSATSYQAVGLAPDTAYTFEVAAGDVSVKESTPSISACATTDIDPWDVQATGGSTVAEGGEYTLNLSIDPTPDAQAFDHFTVDWGDGTDDSSYTLNQLPATHVFATGIDSSIIDVTASTAGGSGSSLTVTAAPIGVDLIPKAPTNLQTSIYSPTEVDLSWTDNSLDADGYDVLSSVNGASFQTLAEVGSTDDSYDDTSVTPGQQVAYAVVAVGSTASNASAPAPAPTVTVPMTMPAPGTPTLSVALSGTNSATLTWTYQGADDSGFELEMMDEGAGTNFQLIATPGSVGASGTGSTTVTGLTSGDTYDFRMRADHTGGTASRYVTQTLTVGAAPAPQLSTDTIITAANDNNVPTYGLRLDWSGVPDGDSVELQVSGDAFAGLWHDVTFTANSDPYWPANFHGSEGGWDTDGFDMGQYYVAGLQGYIMYPEVVGPGTFNYRIRAIGSGGPASGWSAPQSYTLSASPGPVSSVPTISLSATNTTLTVDWQTLVNYQDGVNENVFLQAVGQPGNGVGVGIPIASYSSFFHGFGSFSIQDPAQPASFQTSFTDLAPGTQYSVCVWNQEVDDDHLFDISFAKATMTTSGGSAVAPAAPDKLWAVDLGDGVNQSQVELIWHNSSENEDGFLIQRFIQGAIVGWTTIGRVGADVTNYIGSITFGDLNVPDSNYHYRVAAYRGNAQSAWSPITSITPFQAPIATAISWIPATVPLTIVAYTYNEPPPLQFGDPSSGDSFADWLEDGQYRNVLRVQAGISIDPYSGLIVNATADIQRYVGYTPTPWILRHPMLKGQGPNPTVTKAFNANHTQVTYTVFAPFRLNTFENSFNYLVASWWAGGFQKPHMACWAWAQIQYTVTLGNSGISANGSFTGSLVPAQSDYWGDQNQVGLYTLGPNSNLAPFLSAPHGANGPSSGAVFNAGN